MLETEAKMFHDRSFTVLNAISQAYGTRGYQNNFDLNSIDFEAGVVRGHRLLEPTDYSRLALLHAEFLPTSYPFFDEDGKLYFLDRQYPLSWLLIQDEKEIQNKVLAGFARAVMLTLEKKEEEKGRDQESVKGREII